MLQYFKLKKVLKMQLLILLLICFSTIIGKEKNLSYVDILSVHPGQLRYSYLNVQEKCKELESKSSNGKLPYDSERSFWSKRNAFLVVRSPVGYILIDGHHTVMAGISLGTKTIPIKEIANYSNLSEEAFWKKAEELGLVYLKAISGKKEIPPREFHLLQDDPNRYFATLVSRKFDADGLHSKGAEYPLWIKIGKDIPFIEFKIADALYQNGLLYEDSPSFQEKARQVLLESQIPGLRVLPEKKHYTEIILNEQLNS